MKSAFLLYQRSWFIKVNSLARYLACVEGSAIVDPAKSTLERNQILSRYFYGLKMTHKAGSGNKRLPEAKEFFVKELRLILEK